MEINLNKLKSEKTIQELLEFGIINIDKPAGMTSFDVSDYVRKTLKLRKTSHFGTLDPMVTGVLPIALNRACKLTGFFLGEDKEYIGVMRIHEDVSVEKIEEAIKKGFIGKIIQMPPVKSRVKRQEREREIKKFEILKKEDRNISFIVECQGGTYIRKLVHDLGEEMGIGAHMIALRRIRAGIFKEKESVSQQEFERAVEEYERQKAEPLASSSENSQTKGDESELRKMIIPAEIVSEVYGIVKIKKEHLGKILHGSPLNNNFLEGKEKFEKGKIVSVFFEERFIGMYKVVNEGERFAKPEFILQPMNQN
ncbi:MAG: RNA-guided pseudouridylation complex pseudouridine synthase subunit Cbf5 [Candidatus Pacearchaeota archaeon]|nr:RNA-guided pseudouridylation complex pseudouridine synthase subunit Cbf5 [Candidatus Pacearchaeota archaeon]